MANKQLGKEILDGGPAFPGPKQVVLVPQECDHARQIQVQENGMSLRDWFAGMALQGILASNAPIHLSSLTDKEKKLTYGELLAFRCYAYADSMLKQRPVSEGTKE